MYVPQTDVYLDAYTQCEYVSDPPPPLIRISTLTTGYHPETWDRDIILHEYGHRVADFHDFFFSDTGVHAWNDTLTLNLASTEAWADFFAAWVTGDPLIEDKDYGFMNVYQWSCENGEWGENGAVYGSANNYGKYTQGAVAGILWDIFDQAHDDYDGDDRGDTLWDGIDNILIALKDRTVNGHHPDNIDEFWEAWFEMNSMLGHSNAMQDIWYEHGEIIHCCNGDGMRGNADGVTGIGGAIDVGDLTYLVKYLFKSGPPPPCKEEGDADGSGSIDVADLTLLTCYLFKGGPPPPYCP